jgi:hypothetical protein
MHECVSTINSQMYTPNDTSRFRPYLSALRYITFPPPRTLIVLLMLY